MAKGSRISDEVIEGVSACIVDTKNPKNCIKKVLEEHGLSEDDEARVLTKVAQKGLQ